MNATKQLQSIGRVPAIQAGDIKAGDVLLWNFGHKSRVDEIVSTTNKSIFIKETSLESGKQYERRFLKTRLVGISHA